MVKKCLLLCFLFVFSSAMLGFAQEEETSMVEGTVTEISEDNSYIVVDGVKVLTTEDFILDSYLEEGDEVEITVNKTEAGLEAVSCEYVSEGEDVDEEIFIEEPETTDVEETETDLPEGE